MIKNIAKLIESIEEMDVDKSKSIENFLKAFEKNITLKNFEEDSENSKIIKNRLVISEYNAAEEHGYFGDLNEYEIKSWWEDSSSPHPGAYLQVIKKLEKNRYTVYLDKYCLRGEAEFIFQLLNEKNPNF